jgi:hypothetical protein
MSYVISAENTMHLCMKMEKRDLLKLFQEWGKGNKGE